MQQYYVVQGVCIVLQLFIWAGKQRPISNKTSPFLIWMVPTPASVQCTYIHKACMGQWLIHLLCSCGSSKPRWVRLGAK